MLSNSTVITSITVNKVPNVMLISLRKATYELPLSCVTLQQNKVDQLVVAFLKTGITFNCLSVIVCKNFSLHQ